MDAAWNSCSGVNGTKKRRGGRWWWLVCEGDKEGGGAVGVRVCVCVQWWCLVWRQQCVAD